jgi:hypothetical protein
MAVASILFASTVLAPALAQDGFRSPSGNIHCQFFAGASAGDATIRCDLRQISNRPLPRPRDCDLDWGQAFEISVLAKRGTPLCYGDTVQDNRLPVLPYGQNWQRAGLTCISEQSGISCRNASGHGFTLSRAAQNVF